MFERVGIKHPNCCKGHTGSGQCNFKAVENSAFCMIHGGRAKVAPNRASALKNYLIDTKIGQRAGELANSPALKDLTDEVALTRVTLEGIFKNIKNDTDFLIYYDKIAQLVRSVQILLESMQKMQEKNKELIDRQTLMIIADSIVTIIIQFVDDPDKQRECGEAIYGCIISGIGGQIQVQPEST